MVRYLITCGSNISYDEGRLLNWQLLQILRGAMLESRYQALLIKKLHLMFPGCLVLKNNPNHLQGVPDLLILYSGTWGALEVKNALDAKIGANQRHYVTMMNNMSFAAFICPENEEEVLNDLQHALEARRPTRVSKSK